jgi:hypothetical protein
VRAAALGPSPGLDGFDEHLDRLAHALLGALGRELLDEPAHLLGPRAYLVVGQLAVVARGLGAVLVGVAEDADDIQAGVDEELPSTSTSASVSPGKPTITLERTPASGARDRIAASRSRNLSASPKRRIRRSTGPLACWKDRSKYAATPGVELSVSRRPGRTSAGCR